MSFRLVLSAAVVLLPLHVSAAETIWTEIVVRVYDSTGSDASDRRAALKVAASIVSIASVELAWRTCDRPAQPHSSTETRFIDPCDAPMRPGELAVRILRSRTTDDSKTPPLGDALIDGSGAGVLATIYFDRVEMVAAQTGVDVRTLLGRAIAHELGHLLMATSTHGTYGLMRPLWSQSEIRRHRTHDWLFSPVEIAAIRARRGR
jgi:hypothetical protein